MTENKAQTHQARLALDVRDLDLAEHYAQILRESGFKVLKVAPRGVSFEGEASVFLDVFQSPVDDDAATEFSTPPTLPESLSSHVASVYFPTKPKFIGTEQELRREESE